MIKKIFKIITRIIFAISVVYGLDMITSSIGFIVPINIITIAMITILGFPGLFLLVSLSLIL